MATATPLYSGAELAALTNEAAIRAVRRGAESLRMVDFEGAVQSFSSSRRRSESLFSKAKTLLQ